MSPSSPNQSTRGRRLFGNAPREPVLKLKGGEAEVTLSVKRTKRGNADIGYVA